MRRPRGFEIYVETQLAPVLDEGEAVIFDNLPGHKCENPQGMRSMVPFSATLFARLKSNRNDLWKVFEPICDRYSPGEFRNYFKSAGYGSD